MQARTWVLSSFLASAPTVRGCLMSHMITHKRSLLSVAMKMGMISLVIFSFNVT